MALYGIKENKGLEEIVIPLELKVVNMGSSGWTSSYNGLYVSKTVDLPEGCTIDNCIVISIVENISSGKKYFGSTTYDQWNSKATANRDFNAFISESTGRLTVYLKDSTGELAVNSQSNSVDVYLLKFGN